MNYIDALSARLAQVLPVELHPKNNAGSLFRTYALLILVVGQDVTMENVHDAWSVWKSSSSTAHKSIRPFKELDHETREKDRPYMQALQVVAAELQASAGQAGFHGVKGSGLRPPS